MFDINGWEVIVIALLGVLILGPERLPVYAAKLGQWVRQLRQMADNARGQLNEQMGPEFAEMDWSAYDPRQYDPRRIVREALADSPPSEPDGSPVEASTKPVSGQMATPSTWDPTKPVPWDSDAT